MVAIDTTMMDGPYLKYDDDEIIISWVEKGEFKEKVVKKDEDFSFNREGLPSFSLRDIKIKNDDEVEITGVEKFVALSDIHGQFDVFERLLVANKITDDEANWTYGNGHLVVVGDILDRGDEVLKILWYLYHLERKAEKEGGRVHVLLGNHEMMVINGELGYLNRKYLYTSGVSGVKYSEYFGKDTFWGRYLASKNVIKSINNILFVHGGLSKAALDAKKNYFDYNKIFKKNVLFKSPSQLAANKVTSVLAFENGPLWYRGYARPFEFDTEKAKDILRMTGKDHIVIGHTSMPRVMGLYDNRIILVDSSMKFGKTGELLVYEDGKFFRGLMDGRHIELISENDVQNKESISAALYNQNGPALFIKMKHNFPGLKKLDSEVYFSTYFDLYGLDFEAQAQTEMKKSFRRCSEYLLTAEIPGDQLENFGFSDNGNVEVILPCDDNNDKNWIAQKIGQLAKSETGKLYKAIRVLIQDANKKGIDRKGIMIINTESD